MNIEVGHGMRHTARGTMTRRGGAARHSATRKAFVEPKVVHNSA